jgi:hypothetical protein
MLGLKEPLSKILVEEKIYNFRRTAEPILEARSLISLLFVSESRSCRRSVFLDYQDQCRIHASQPFDAVVQIPESQLYEL